MKKPDKTQPLALSFSGSEDERAAIKEYCRRQGLTMGQFVRLSVFKVGGDELRALLPSFAAASGSAENRLVSEPQS